MERIEVRQTAQFEREMRALTRKFRTLPDDFQVLLRASIQPFHVLRIDNGGIERISRVGKTEIEFYKVTKFACKTLKGRGAKSGLRVIYAYYPEEPLIEFIEIYFKGDKPNHDHARIKEYIVEHEK